MSALFPIEQTSKHEAYSSEQVSSWIPTCRPGRETHLARLCWTRQRGHLRGKAGGAERAAEHSQLSIPKSPTVLYTLIHGRVFHKAGALSTQERQEEGKIQLLAPCALQFSSQLLYYLMNISIYLLPSNTKCTLQEAMLCFVYCYILNPQGLGLCLGLGRHSANSCGINK